MYLLYLSFFLYFKASLRYVILYLCTKVCISQKMQIFSYIVTMQFITVLQIARMINLKKLAIWPRPLVKPKENFQQFGYDFLTVPFTHMGAFPKDSNGWPMLAELDKEYRGMWHRSYLGSEMSLLLSSRPPFLTTS